MAMVRIITAVISILLVVNAMSFYGQPFSGCEVTGLTTFRQGCHSWQYFGLGLAIVLLFWTVKPKQASLKYWGLAFVILLALLGGPEALNDGLHLDIKSNLSGMIYSWRNDGFAMLVGGLAGVVLLVVLTRCLSKKKIKKSNH